MSIKRNVSSGFLSQKDRPTQNALMMYFVYLTNLPEGWDIMEINNNAVAEVRKYFNWKFTHGLPY